MVLSPSRAGILPGLLLLAAAGAHAEDWALCPPQPELPQTRLPAEPAAGGSDAVADDVTSAGSVHVLTGNVELRKENRWIGADRIEIDRNDQVAHAEGNVYLRSDEYAIFSPRGEVDMDTGAFDVERPHVLYPGFHGQGDAARAARDESGVATLSDASWSTCPENDEVWALRASESELNPNNRQGTAHHASLWFKGVPLLYSPWFRFPIGEARLSGFLPPRIGSSSDSGTEISVPWYWNIAPSLDATLTPRWLSRRGTQLQTETRWLGPAGYWQFDLHYLPDDAIFGADRTLAQLRQQGRFAHGLRSDIDLAGVSDDEYFDDLGDPLSITGRTHLQSRADVFWNSDYGRSRLRLQSFRTLDETIAASDRPYKQLPQITHRWDGNWPSLSGGLDSELVRFERDDSDTASRFRFVPAIGHEFETPGWFLRPRLAWDYTAYEIDRVTSPGDRRIERSLPIFSLDSGLVFERLGEGYRQTLEPRAFYVYIPDENQDDIPLFDTGEFTFSFSQLFRERRFTGGDRIGDANRLSLALTSRLLDRDSGAEVLRGSIGVIHHFDEREVALIPGTAPATEDLSDVVAEIAARPGEHWRAKTTAQWNPDGDFTQRHDSRIAYRGPAGGIANFGYRFQKDQREQVDASFAWPINPRWTLLARSNYSLRAERNIENLLGLEYEDCCWRLRTVAREFIDEADGGVESDQSIYFELVLKGLGGFGDEAGSVFENAILGYRDPGNQTLR